MTLSHYARRLTHAAGNVVGTAAAVAKLVAVMTLPGGLAFWLAWRAARRIYR
jgi:hypothetical protein